MLTSFLIIIEVVRSRPSKVGKRLGVSTVGMALPFAPQVLPNAWFILRINNPFSSLYLWPDDFRASDPVPSPQTGGDLEGIGIC